jgi:hypothetical protein
MRSGRQRVPLDRSKGQVTGTDIHVSGTLDLDSDDSEDDRVDGLEIEYKSEVAKRSNGDPKLRQRIAGKSIPLEMFVERKCEIQGGRLVLSFMQSCMHHAW